MLLTGDFQVELVPRMNNNYLVRSRRNAPIRQILSSDCLMPAVHPASAIRTSQTRVSETALAGSMVRASNTAGAADHPDHDTPEKSTLFGK